MTKICKFFWKVTNTGQTKYGVSYGGLESCFFWTLIDLIPIIQKKQKFYLLMFRINNSKKKLKKL